MSKKFNFLERLFNSLQMEHAYQPWELQLGTETFQIREVKYSDIKRLIAIQREVYEGQVPWGRTAFLEELNGTKPILYLVAEHEGEIIGFIGVRFENGDGHITNVAIVKAYQNLGLGHYFFREAEKVARQNDYESLSLDVRNSNLDAQRLYRRLGFVTQRVKPDYYRNNNEDALDMLYLLEEFDHDKK